MAQVFPLRLGGEFQADSLCYTAFRHSRRFSSTPAFTSPARSREERAARTVARARKKAVAAVRRRPKPSATLRTSASVSAGWASAARTRSRISSSRARLAAQISRISSPAP
jgi:hypothetical protein